MIVPSITPMISIRPNRITLTNLVRYISLGNFFEAPQVAVIDEQSKEIDKKGNEVTKKTIERKFHNFEISLNSSKNLRDKISYLFQFAKSRKIVTYSGKTIPNFKVCFLTLTLPSKQVHPTSVINKECLEPFFEVLRKRLKMTNYVWRMEFQSNGNVHYHIATDCYIDYFFALKHWNNITEKLGYVSAFAEKMNGLSYVDYLARYKNNDKINNDVIYKRYLKGRSQGWRNPNTVDVKNAKSSDNIGYYISKYFSKKEKGAKCNSLDNESNSFALRLCFWSRSLSKCKSESMPFDYYAYDLVKLFSSAENVLKKVYDYCKVFYYDFNKLPHTLRAIVGEYFNAVKKDIGYISAI